MASAVMEILLGTSAKRVKSCQDRIRLIKLAQDECLSSAGQETLDRGGEPKERNRRVLTTLNWMRRARGGFDIAIIPPRKPASASPASLGLDFRQNIFNGIGSILCRALQSIYRHGDASA
jgi:hypothetical protein